MPYANTTSNYRIPWWNQGERSSGISNKRAANIVDTQLKGAMGLFGTTGIISEGTYQSFFQTNASRIAVLGSVNSPALEAIINSTYVRQVPNLNFIGIPDDTTAYLYAASVESNINGSDEFSTLSTGQVQAIWNSTGVTPSNSVLLGVASVTTSGISLVTTTATDNSQYISGKPTLFPYNTHRTASVIDHPDRSITSEKLFSPVIKTEHLYTYDGVTSGTEAFSGTGVGTPHLKTYAVTSQKLAPSLSISGLQIQTSLTTTANSVTVLSGVTHVRGRPTLLTEPVSLQFLQESLSGLGSGLATSISGVSLSVVAIANDLSGILNAATAANSTVSGLATKVATLEHNYSGLAATSDKRAGIISIPIDNSGINVLFGPAFSMSPTWVGATIELPDDNPNVITLAGVKSISPTGFTAVFSGITDSSLYKLRYYSFV